MEIQLTAEQLRLIQFGIIMAGFVFCYVAGVLYGKGIK